MTQSLGSREVTVVNNNKMYVMLSLSFVTGLLWRSLVSGNSQANRQTHSRALKPSARSFMGELGCGVV